MSFPAARKSPCVVGRLPLTQTGGTREEPRRRLRLPSWKCGEVELRGNVRPVPGPRLRWANQGGRSVSRVPPGRNGGSSVGRGSLAQLEAVPTSVEGAGLRSTEGRSGEGHGCLLTGERVLLEHPAHRRRGGVEDWKGVRARVGSRH